MNGYRRELVPYTNFKLMCLEVDSIDDSRLEDAEIKKILLNYTAQVNRVLKPLFDEDEMIEDFDLIRQAFSLFGKFNIEESIIEEIINIISKMHNILYDDFYTDVVISDRLANFLDEYNYFSNEKFRYQPSVSKLGQNHITVIGYIILLSIFMGEGEKNSFSFDLTGKGLKLNLTNAITKILRKYPSARYSYIGYDSAQDFREISVNSLIFRRYLIEFLIDIHNDIKCNENVDFGDTFFDAVENYYKGNDACVSNIKKIYDIVSSGCLINESYKNERVGVSYIVQMLDECCLSVVDKKVFQETINKLFVFCVNRKYYNYLKWLSNNAGINFLNKRSEFFSKFLFWNQYVINSDDEQKVYSKSSDKKFAAIDFVQQQEFERLFGSVANFDWDKIDICIYDIDENIYDVYINKDKYNQNLFALKDGEQIEVTVKNGPIVCEWNEKVINDTDISKIVIKTPKVDLAELNLEIAEQSEETITDINQLFKYL